MKKGESRFFLNWQMNKDTSSALFKATSDTARNQISQAWLATTKLVKMVPQDKVGILQQYTETNVNFAFKQNFDEKKMACFVEIMHYLMQMIVSEPLTEDKMYDHFKDLLLRHAVLRPPHSLAIFNLNDVKKIDLFVQDTFIRHFDMYSYAFTAKETLLLKTHKFFER